MDAGGQRPAVPGQLRGAGAEAGECREVVPGRSKTGALRVGSTGSRSLAGTGFRMG